MKLFRLPRLYWSDLKLVGIIAWVGWLGVMGLFGK